MQTTSLTFQGRKKLSRALDMTPLIDVVFLLLLFFILTSAFVVNQGLELNLPEASSVAPLTSEPIQIGISKDNLVHIDGKQITPEYLKEYLTMTIQNPSESQALISSDIEVSVATLISVMDAVNLSGITNISIAAQPVKKNE